MKIKTICLAIMMASSSQAEYRVNIPLEHHNFNFAAPEVAGSIKLSPATINRGESSNIEWDYEYADQINIENIGSYTSKSSSVAVNPLRSTTYKVNIKSGDKSKEESLFLTVIQPEPLIDFTADRYTIGEGETVKLSWDVQNIDSASIDNGIGSVTSHSSVYVVPTDDTTYKLSAIGYFGEKTGNKSLLIDIVKNSVISMFTVNKTKFTIGDTAIFNWLVQDSQGLVLSPFGTVDQTKNTQSIVLNTVGNFDYTLKTTSFNNSTQTSNILPISVYGEPVITSYTVNNKKSVNVETGDDIKFDWVSNNAESTKLDGSIVTGNSTTLKALTSNKTYQLEILNGAGKSVNDNVSVNIVTPVSIATLTAPTPVFTNTPFLMNWTGDSVSKYELSSTSGSGVGSSEDVVTTTSKSITPTINGDYQYILKATSLADKTTEKSINVTVESDPTFTSFTVNGSSAVTVAPSATLTFLGGGESSGAVMTGRNSANTANLALPSSASSTAGTTTYYAAVSKTLNTVPRFSDARSVAVTVVNAPTVGTITAPSSVFNNSTFTMSWSGTNATNYKIKSNNSSSGISTSDLDLNTATSNTITPTAAGTYIYTITAINAAGVTVSSTKQVIVEAIPTFTDFTVNGSSSVTVSPSTSLTFAGAGFSSGAVLQGRNSAGTANATLPATASATAGTITYYAAATKTVNGVTNFSAVRSVSVIVVDAPTMTAITAPSPVFSGSAFTMSWNGTNVSNYKIRSNNPNSGIATADVDLATANSRSIIPIAAGTYTYTITATNAAGVTTTSSKSVVVEDLPSFTDFTVNGSYDITVSPSATLTFVGTGFSAGATLQGKASDRVTNATLPTAANSTSGTTTYYATAIKTVNGVTNNSSLRAVNVTVISAPTIASITSPSNTFINSAFTMSWSGTDVVNYKIKSNNAASGIAVTDIDLTNATSRVITPTAAGTYTYTITATNSFGVTVTSTKQVTVEALPTFTGFTVNGAGSMMVSPSAALTFAGSGFSSGATLQGRNSAGTADISLPTNASSTAGSTTYYASAVKVLNGVTNNSAVRSVSVTVINAPTITSITAPTNVFSGAAFTMSWAATDAITYKIKSNNATSGIAITDVDLASATSRSITPTAAGTYIYTITATNALGVTGTQTQQVIVESDPTFTGFTINGSTSPNVAPSSSLTFAGAGFSSGAVLQGRNSAGTANAVLPATSSATAGTTAYYAAATKILNGVVRYSAVRTASVVVVSAPSITSITAPTPVFEDSAFTMSWAGTNATNYTIKSNNVNSGIAVTDFDLGTATSTTITPIVAGTYIYTLTATNAAGVSVTSTKSVVVETMPTFTGFTVNGSATISVSPSTALTFAGTGFSSGAVLQGRNSAGTANATLPTTASTSAGTTTYYASAAKTLNGITNNSAVSSVSVTVINAPNIGTITAPSNVFSGAAFTMSWSATDAVNYKIKSSNVASGITMTDIDLGTTSSRVITPTAAGTYTYIITATNSLGVTSNAIKQVIVEADPTFTVFTINTLTSVTVSPSSTLTFAGLGFSSGAVLQGRNTTGTADAVLPATASATAGSTSYYASASKTLNGVTRYSAVRSVSVIVINDPTITSITAPTPVFEDTAFTMSWVGTNATNYKIKSNNATSGIAVTDVDLSTATSTLITPTAAGTYTYTITAKNAAGVTTSSTKSVVVEALPTFTGFTVNGSTAITVAPSAALTFDSSGLSAGSVFQPRNSTGTADATLPTTASAVAGTTTYYASVVKIVNGVTNYSALRSVTVTVAGAPTIGTITAPATVFSGAAFTMSWTGTNVTSYSIKSNNAASGIAMTDVLLAAATSRAITPTAAGTYTYTITATNVVGISVTATKQVIVESDPTLGGFLVNGATAISVNTSTAISFSGSGLSAGAVLQGRSGSSDVALPGAASGSAGTITYYAAAKKILNGVARYSANRAVTVTTIATGPVCEDSWGYSYWSETEYEGSGYELSVYWRGVAKYSGYRSDSGGSLVGNDGKTYAKSGDRGVCKMN